MKMKLQNSSQENQGIGTITKAMKDFLKQYEYVPHVSSFHSDREISKEKLSQELKDRATELCVFDLQKLILQGKSS